MNNVARALYLKMSYCNTMHIDNLFLLIQAHSGKIQHTIMVEIACVLGFSIGIVIILEMITPVPSEISVAICMPESCLFHQEQNSWAERAGVNMALSKILRVASSIVSTHCLCSEPTQIPGRSVMLCRFQGACFYFSFLWASSLFCHLQPSWLLPSMSNHV